MIWASWQIISGADASNHGDNNNIGRPCMTRSGDYPGGEFNIHAEHIRAQGQGLIFSGHTRAPPNFVQGPHISMMVACHQAGRGLGGRVLRIIAAFGCPTGWWALRPITTMQRNHFLHVLSGDNIPLIGVLARPARASQRPWTLIWCTWGARGVCMMLPRLVWLTPLFKIRTSRIQYLCIWGLTNQV